MALIRQRILEIAGSLPPGVRIFAELAQLFHREDTPSLDELAALIKRDPGFAGHVIRLGNSVAFAGEQRAASVEDAVARIGLEEVFKIGCELAAQRLAEQPLQHYGTSAEELRAHTVRTAFYCERLAAAVGLDARAAYTAAMLRPIGMLILDRVAQQDGVGAYEAGHDGDVRTWELRGFGLDAGEVGAGVLTEWKFPEEIVAAVRHHVAGRQEDFAVPLACVLNLASGAAAAHGHPMPGESSHWQVTPRKLVAVGLSAEHFATLIESARAAFEHPEQGRRTADPVTPAPAEAKPERGRGAAGRDSCNFQPAIGVLTTNDVPPVHTSEAGVSPAPDFTTFMRNYQNMVFSTAARLTGNDAQAEDISQEVFLKAYENYDHLSTSPTAGGWLKTVATNLSLNHLSRYRNRWRFFSEFKRDADAGDDRDAPEVEFAAPDTFFSGVDADDRRALVEQALAQLPPNQRVPLVLYHFEDMPYDEIAKKLRVSLAKVKTDILRARAALARILARSETAHEKFKF